ncbi:hypothetical protein [Subtercola vilae]|nr:hypothetical protein [Subtercola vilae]
MPAMQRVGRATAGCLALAAVFAVTGCSAHTAGDGQKVADWVAAEAHVSAATSLVDTDLYNQSITLTVAVDPAITDEDLSQLAVQTDHRAEDAGWSNPHITYTLGANHSVSNVGGPTTLAVFDQLRHTDGYLAVNARGTVDCGGSFCVSVVSTDPAALLAAANQLIGVAARVGGVQTNLFFAASTEGGRFVVRAQPGATPDAAVALWQSIAATVPLARADAYEAETSDGSPPAPQLDLIVASADQQATAERLVAAQTAVEARVYLAAG